jgi:hypothetical protein
MTDTDSYTQRKYAVTVPGNVHAHEFTASWSVSAYDIAKGFLGRNYPGYKLVSVTYYAVQETPKFGLHTLYRAEAVNADQTEGLLFHVRELGCV